MKRDIHPVYQTCAVTCGCGNTFTTRSTKPKIGVEICSQCHPFFTGKQKFVDTAGMVEKFQKKYASKDYAAAKRVKVRKVSKAAAPGGPVKGTNADLALASAPGTPKAPPPAPGKAKGGFGFGIGFGRGKGAPEGGAETAAKPEAAGKAPAGKKEGAKGAPHAKAEGAAKHAPSKVEGHVPSKAEGPAAPAKAPAPKPATEKAAPKAEPKPS